MSENAGPLAGIRVVELGGIGPGPFCAMLLADLGAEVVRIHRPGDVRVAPNPVLDRGRTSIAVNLKSSEGSAVVRRIIDSSDVLIEGFRPGVLERLGFVPDELRETNPKLVVGRMTGFGQSGPLAARAGHDINYIALSGALASIGRAGQAPVPPLNLVGDFGGGGMLLALGVVSAVLNARSTGTGQDVDAAMVDGSAVLMAMIHGYRAQGRWRAERGTNMFDGSVPYYDTYECSDGKYMSVGAIEPQFFAELVRGLELADVVALEDQNNREVWPGMRAEFVRAFASRTRDEWAKRFDDVDACVSPVLDIDEAPHNAHLADRRTFVTDDAGVVHPAPAPRFTKTGLAAPTSPPTPGSGTDAILGELGLPSSEIDRLRREGIVA